MRKPRICQGTYTYIGWGRNNKSGLCWYRAVDQSTVRKSRNKKRNGKIATEIKFAQQRELERHEVNKKKGMTRRYSRRISNGQDLLSQQNLFMFIYIYSCKKPLSRNLMWRIFAIFSASTLISEFLGLSSKHMMCLGKTLNVRKLGWLSNFKGKFHCELLELIDFSSLFYFLSKTIFCGKNLYWPKWQRWSESLYFLGQNEAYFAIHSGSFSKVSKFSLTKIENSLVSISSFIPALSLYGLGREWSSVSKHEYFISMFLHGLCFPLRYNFLTTI